MDSKLAAARRTAQPLYQPGDLDGFFGLAIDNLIQFLLILSLCRGVLGFSVELLLGRVLPGAALSVIVGNLYYAWQAQQLSRREGRSDVTALPYGINTVSLFAFIFLVMLPAKLAAEARGADAAEAALAAWQVGLGACLLSGLIELAGALVGDAVRRATPRAALLSTLAGIAISFIAIDFAVRTLAAPLVAMLPLGIILTTYFAGVAFPFRIPGGAWAVLAGTALAWLAWAAGTETTPVDWSHVVQARASIGLYLPVPVLGDLYAGLTSPLMRAALVPVVLPMGLFNVLGSLQNIESADAAGDAYPAMPCMAVNGIGSIVAATLGSCFPTTIYIGHPGWKALGARSGYSILNAVFFAVMALGGLTYLVGSLIPIEAGMAIVLWIGIIITAQAFQVTDVRHAPAVAIGLFPAIAAWGLLVLTQSLNAAAVAQGNLALPSSVLDSPAAFSAVGLRLDGFVAISQGFMLTCMIWSAMSAHLIDRQFARAAVWAGIGAGLSFFGFIHAGRVTPAGGVYDIGFASGLPWAIGYALCGLFFLAVARFPMRPDPHDL
jgi:AGZA family xanthine/uracil permease-like MFS transporter